MELTTAAAALDILSKTWNALEAVRERSQQSKDAALKANVGELYDDFNSLRSVIARLTEENETLRKAQIEKPRKPEAREVGETVYYFDGEKGPFCQKCYDGNDKLVTLGPRLESYVGGPGRKCAVCGTVFHEQNKPRRVQFKPFVV
jgi:hypothetical protein